MELYYSGRLLNLNGGQIDDTFATLAIKCMQEHKEEFQRYLYEKSKLQAVKALKDYTGGGLKECKDICDLYWEGQLPFLFIKEERLKKLERLAKNPLVEELMIKIKNIKEDEIHSLLLNLTVDQLLAIDEILINNNK